MSSKIYFGDEEVKVDEDGFMNITIPINTSPEPDINLQGICIMTSTGVITYQGKPLIEYHPGLLTTWKENLSRYTAILTDDYMAELLELDPTSKRVFVFDRDTEGPAAKAALAEAKEYLNDHHDGKGSIGFTTCAPDAYGALSDECASFILDRLVTPLTENVTFLPISFGAEWCFQTTIHLMTSFLDDECVLWAHIEMQKDAMALPNDVPRMKGIMNHAL